MSDFLCLFDHDVSLPPGGRCAKGDSAMDRQLQIAYAPVRAANRVGHPRSHSDASVLSHPARVLQNTSEFSALMESARVAFGPSAPPASALVGFATATELETNASAAAIGVQFGAEYSYTLRTQPGLL